MMGTAEKATLTSEAKKNEKLKDKADQATIVEGLQKILEPNEQLLAFTRGRIAGGWRGKLNIGPEAFFAPIVNLGLTERRVIMQHIHAAQGSPSNLAPHLFSLSQMQSIDFTDVETFSEDRACRIILKLNREQHFRIRVSGISNVESARNLAEVFNTISKNHSPFPNRPSQYSCPHCQNLLETVGKFCPFCGGKLETKISDPAPEQNHTDLNHDFPLTESGVNVNEYDANPSNYETPATDMGDSAAESNEDPPISEFLVCSETSEAATAHSEEADDAGKQLDRNDVLETVTKAEEAAQSRSFWHQPEGEF